jgi:two-component system, NarL family, nitrate/nitrite response regulator NarL
MSVLAKMNNCAANNALTMPTSIRIAVINGQPIFRAGLIRMLDGVDDIEVVGEGANAADALKVAQELVPDVILLDLRLPGGGIEAAASIARVCPNVRTVILTTTENEQDVALTLQAGARGYIMTSSSGREVVATVRAIIRGDSRAPRLAPRLLIKNGDRIDTIVNDNLRNLKLSQRVNAPIREG